MDEKNKKMLGESMKKAVSDNAGEFLAQIPVVGKIASVSYKTVKQGVSGYQDAKVEEAKEPYPPLYMDCATFYCREGYLLSEGQQEILTEIVLGNYEEGDEEALEILMGFIEEYTDINYTVTDDDSLSEDCGGIDERSIWLNFQEGNEFPYDGEALERVMGALNSLLGVSIFEKFDVAGHNESLDL